MATPTACWAGISGYAIRTRFFHEASKTDRVGWLARLAECYVKAKPCDKSLKRLDSPVVNSHTHSLGTMVYRFTALTVEETVPPGILTKSGVQSRVQAHLSIIYVARGMSLLETSSCSRNQRLCPYYSRIVA